MAMKPIKTGSNPAPKAVPDRDAPAAREAAPVQRGSDQRFTGLQKPRSAAAAEAASTAIRRASLNRAPSAASTQTPAALPQKPLIDVAAARLLGRYPPHVVEQAAGAALRGLRGLQDDLKKGSAG